MRPTRPLDQPPQRIEQRIGRCHRYGQEHDVVVLNFLNKDNAAATATLMYRNAGQVCVSPSRFYVQSRIYDRFAARFIETISSTNVGNGLEKSTQMGPLAHARHRRGARPGSLIGKRFCPRPPART